MKQLGISRCRFFAGIAFVLAFLMLGLDSSGRPRSLSSYDPQANQLLARMTLEEKIGQMIQAESTSLLKESDIETYYLGSILSSGDADPPSGNTLEYWTEKYERLQKRTRYTRLKIPLLYGVDAVHGHSNVLGAVIFPHNIGLGCTRNPELVREIGRITAREVRATGIQWTFAPCVAVPQDERWGRTYEGFSEDPQLCALLGAAAVRGLQGDNLRNPYSVLACAKHYVGDGGTLFGTSENGRGLDQGDVRTDEETLRRIHLTPYPAAIQAGVGTIMPSYSSWNGVKCSANKYLLTTVLKEELGFEGFLISDYNAIRQVHPDFKTAIGICINAGMDMAMEPNRYREFFVYLKELVEEGTVPMSRIDDAVRRILRVKYAMGLMDKGYSLKADRRLQKEFGSEAHRRVARQAVRESLVLLKNENRTLPLSKKAARIHVAGRSADNLGNQCGGWTITWQGQSGPVTLNGTTVLTAIRRTVSEQTLVTYSDDGKRAEGADVAVVVIGERPYAEGYGDRENLEISREDKRVIENVKKAGIPIVVVLFSGRPLILGEVLDQADALIAAWLPGTEGQGIADVLFGDYKPTGKLSFSWPKSMDQIPINLGDKPYEPLFEYGYGLTY
ncbi:MAG TPA: glycoside hydrolase family 3 N-terminal domain-containing protein [Anaerohalosphaeraceae bacterium]|nr:glycoside hydrolase family 3 N-terminal domain-containing protein [Anaerohalosphaeraceae bacterium]